MKSLIKKIILFSPLIFMVYYVYIRDLTSNLPFILSNKNNFIVKEDGYYLRLNLWKIKKDFKLTIDKELQEMVEENFNRFNKTDYIVFFLMDLKKKEIVSFYEKGGIYNKPLVAASLFKIITTIAALSSGEFGFYDYVSYKGSPHSSKPYEWVKGDEKLISIKDAFGTSNNPAYGVIGRKIGIERIKRVSEKLYLGGGIRFINTGFIIDTTSIEKLSSGLAGSYFSPIYTMLLTAGIGNNGEFFIPRMIKDSDVYSFGRIIDEDIVYSIVRYSQSTTTNGTSRRSYQRIKSEIKMGGKTGSLTGYEPFGKYEWFVGWAPVDNPEVCVVVLGIFDKLKEFYPNETGLYFMKIYLEK